jgi:tetratricopeptide (TPR) repeat protein
MGGSGALGSQGAGAPLPEAAGLVPRQLPVAVRGFVNRVTDLAELDEILQGAQQGAHGAPVCLITGSAGVGKTALAVAWAHRVSAQFPDGQLYVNLRGYDPGEIVSPWRALGRFLAALGVAEAEIPGDAEARAELYRSILANRRVLVVLDNAAEVGQVRLLLPGSTGCMVLVTSRSRLPGLVALEGAVQLRLEVFAERAAVELLQVTAGRYRRGDDEQEMAELAGLCARLPLALRIAAVHAATRPQMPLRALIQDLRGDSCGLWAALTLTDEDEAAAVRSVFAWSFRALREPAARVFRLLGLHPGPDFTAAAVAALCGQPLNEVRRELDALIDASLLEPVGRDRYRFHDLLRAYAGDQAREQEPEREREEAVRRVLEWYLRSVRRAVELLGSSFQRLRIEPEPMQEGAAAHLTDRAEAVAWLEAEWDNLRGAARVAAERRFDQIAWQLPVALHDFYQTHNSFDGRLAMERDALQAALRIGDRAAQAQCLYCMAVSTLQLDRPREALDLFWDAFALYQEMGERRGQALALNSLGFTCFKLGAYTEAAEHHRRAAQIIEELGDVVWQASTARNAIEAELETGSAPPDAEAVLTRAWEIHAGTDSVADLVDTLVVLARLRRAEGDRQGAYEAARAAVEAGAEARSAMLEGYALLELTRIQLVAGETSQALASAHRCAVLHRTTGSRGREAEAFELTGQIYTAMGRDEDAIGFHRRAVAVFADLGFTARQESALVHLADALERTGDDGKAADARREAESLASQTTARHTLRPPQLGAEG